MSTSREKGFKTEALAKNFLTQQKLTLIDSNFQTRFGEIDIIALDGQDLIFIEVRYRKNNAYGGAAASVTFNKQKRLLTSAELYLQQYRQHLHRNMRFDVVAISDQQNESGYHIEWIKNAFQAA